MILPSESPEISAFLSSLLPSMMIGERDGAKLKNSLCH